MIKTIENHRIYFQVFLFVTTLIFGISNDAFAKNGSFYIGFSGDVVRSGFEHAKTIDNTNVPDSYLQKGNSYSETESINKTGFGGRLFVGYQLNLDSTGTAYLAIEANGGIDSGKPTGMFVGKGQSEGKNQLGELWPDKLTVERKFNYGGPFLLGASPEVLTSFLVSRAGVYILGGFQRLHTKLTTADYNGCLIADKLCAETEFTSGSVFYDKALFGGTFGGGIEKMIGEKTGIFVEVRHTRYAKKEWDTWEELLDSNETSFSLVLRQGQHFVYNVF